MQSHEITHKQTHNLEVPGSSPGWSTTNIKELQNYLQLFFFYTNTKANLYFPDSMYK